MKTRETASKSRSSGVTRPARRSLVGAAASAAFATTLLGAAPEARAQYEALTVVLVAAAVVDGGVAAGGLVTGIGSTVHVAQSHYRRGWFVAGLVFSGLNAAIAIPWTMESANAASHGHRDPFFDGIAAAHISLATINLVVPTIGLIRGKSVDQPAAQLRPVVVGGTDAGGQRWTGAGLQIIGF